MDEILFHLSRHLETMQVHVHWGLMQSRQLGLTWSSSVRHHMDVFLNCHWGEYFKQIASGTKNAIIRASTVLAQPSEMYHQIYELVRLEMPIIYPGGAGFLTGAIVGVLIGLSIQQNSVPSQRMKAVVCMSYDGLDSVSCIEDQLVPTITQKNQVLIQVKASSVDIIDIRISAGYGRSFRRLFGLSGPNMRYEFPITLGRDCSGIVIEIGQGVQKLDIGDEVWAIAPFWASGVMSEFVVLPEEWVAKKPRGVGFEGAASLPYAGSLAYSACLKSGILNNSEPGKRVLIQSGVSPVGCIVCQLARLNGFEVTVTCSALGAPVARALGASEVVTYGQIDLENQLTKDRFDIVLNTVGGVSYDSCRLLCKSDGVVVTTVPVPISSDYYTFPISFLHGLYLKSKAVLKKLSGRSIQWTEVEFSGAVLDNLSLLVDEGKIHPVVDKIFSPQDAALALQHCDSNNAIGKTVIRFRGEILKFLNKLDEFEETMSLMYCLDQMNYTKTTDDVRKLEEMMLAPVFACLHLQY